MTVKDLIDELNKMPRDLTVVGVGANGFYEVTTVEITKHGAGIDTPAVLLWDKSQNEASRSDR